MYLESIQPGMDWGHLDTKPPGYETAFQITCGILPSVQEAASYLGRP